MSAPLLGFNVALPSERNPKCNNKCPADDRACVYSVIKMQDITEHNILTLCYILLVFVFDCSLIWFMFLLFFWAWETKRRDSHTLSTYTALPQSYSAWVWEDNASVWNWAVRTPEVCEVNHYSTIRNCAVLTGHHDGCFFFSLEDKKFLWWRRICHFLGQHDYLILKLRKKEREKENQLFIWLTDCAFDITLLVK